MTTTSKIELIDKELKLLGEIYREQIVEKQIVSWLNSEQFIRRNFNYNSFVCVICNCTKTNILESHYLKQSGTTKSNVNTNASNASTTNSTNNRMQFYTDEMKTVVLTNHVLGHFNEYCFRCMSCKISWPDRTQLLKHAQECSNSQVVRTKTKYKLKANCRLQLRFYLQSYIDYWTHEKCLDTNSLKPLATTTTMAKDLECRIMLKDILLNKKLLLDVSNRFHLNAISLSDEKKLVIANEEEEAAVVVAGTVDEEKNNDVSMNEIS